MQHGYAHLRTVHESLRVLYGALRHGRIPAPPTALWRPAASALDGDPVIEVQKLVRRIAGVYRLDVGTIVVSFGDIEVPGRVELGASRDFFVEIHTRHRHDPRTLAAVLAHEVAHIFLHRHGIRFEVTLENEILTDVTAVFYGFGALLLDTYKMTETREAVPEGTRITRHEAHMGYLTPEECALAIQKSGFSGGAEHLESQAARLVHAGAEREVAALRRQPPLAAAPWWQRAWYRLSRWWALRRDADRELADAARWAFQAGKVVFRCPRCAQRLRLPLARAVKATCPGCHIALLCET